MPRRPAWALVPLALLLAGLAMWWRHPCPTAALAGGLAGSPYVILDLPSGATFPFEHLPAGIRDDRRLRDTWMLFKRIPTTPDPTTGKKRLLDFTPRKPVDEGIHSVFFLALAPATPAQLAWIRNSCRTLPAPVTDALATIPADAMLGDRSEAGLAARYRQTRNPCLTIPTLTQFKAGMEAAISPDGRPLQPARIPAAPEAAPAPAIQTTLPELTAEGHAITWRGPHQGTYEAAADPSRPLAVRFALVAPAGQRADDLPVITHSRTDAALPTLLPAPVFGRVSATYNDFPPLKTRWIINPWSPGHIACRYEAGTLRHHGCEEVFSSLHLDDREAIDLELGDSSDDWDAGMPVVAMAPGRFMTYDQPGDADIILPGDYSINAFDHIRRHDFGAVLIDHGGFASAYLHMKDVAVQPGDAIEAGQLLGRIGDVHPEISPNHLHTAWYKVIRRPVLRDDGTLDAVLEMITQPCRFWPRPFRLEMQQDDGSWSAEPTLHLRKGQPRALAIRTDLPGLPSPLPATWIRPGQLATKNLADHAHVLINGMTMVPTIESAGMDLMLRFSGEAFVIHVVIGP